MIDMPLEFGGQGRTYLFKLSCIPAGALFFYFVEYILLILPRLLRVRYHASLAIGVIVLSLWFCANLGLACALM